MIHLSHSLLICHVIGKAVQKTKKEVETFHGNMTTRLEVGSPKKQEKDLKEHKVHVKHNHHHHHHHHHRSDPAHFKLGQKHSTPPVSDPTRVFYESLLDEKPDSPIAIKYCVEHGTLTPELHKPTVKKYVSLLKKGVISTGKKMPVPKAR